ncbi:MAG: class I SAM-dependent methyltransferase [Candidatus Omnitrophica bacterium]|nr:class I SAM-dependent methyltransferase [Candidatus Omnitrophota bacterium]MCM8802480.1 class I SAM-dependent methyltransferase [Candidatus Omnitrophota bacterium]
MVKCTFCAGNTFLKIKIKNWKIYQCKSCKISFLYPFPEQIEKIYNEKYFERWYLPTYEQRKKYLERIFLKIEPYIVQKGKVLDIGCGVGIMLELMKEKGFEVVGQDISQFSIEFCKKKGFKVYSSISEINSENRFDLITMIDVIAHIKDPLYYLQKCKKLLKSEGFLIIKTPLHSNFIFFVGKIFSFIEKSKSFFHIPAQIYHFDKNSFFKIAQLLDLKLVKILIFKEFISKKFNLFNIYKFFVEKSLVIILRNG